MTENNQIQSDQVKNSKIELLDESVSNLNVIRKWTNFLAILGFIVIGIMVLVGFTASLFFSRFPGGGLGRHFPGFLFGFIYLVFALINFFPIFYLFRFANYTKKALDKNSSSELNVAFQNLKAHYQYIGVLVIVIFGLYLMIFLIAMAAGAFFHFG